MKNKITFILKCLVFQSLLLFSTSIYAQLDNYRNSAGSKVTYGEYVQEKAADKARQPNSPSGRSSSNVDNTAYYQKIWDDVSGKTEKDRLAAEKITEAERKAKDAVRQKEYNEEQARQWERDRPQREAEALLVQKYQQEREEYRQKQLTAIRDAGKKKAAERAAEFPKGVTPIYLIELENGNKYYVWEITDKSRYVLYKFKNGDIFEASIADMDRHIGKITKANGDVYTGEINNDIQFEGEGKLVFANKSGIYTGAFKSDYFNGQGTIRRTNGFYLKGTFLNGDAKDVKYYNAKNEAIRLNEYLGIPKSGYGKVEYNDCTYEGNWENSLQNGHGTKQWAKDNSYTGEFKDNKLDGKGTYYLSNGSVYTGDFKENNFNGQGTMKYNDGYTYTGQWKDDNKKGTGILTRPDGFYVKGTFKDNLYSNEKYYSNKNEEITLDEYNGIPKSGHGKIKYSNGNTYEGNFENVEPNGKGVYTFVNGVTYTGDFVNGMFEGKGTKKWTDGSSYTGDFIKDKLEGKGTYKFTSGNIYEGDFVDGMFEGKGIMKFASGTIYEGGFVNDKFEGKGTIKWNDGDSYTGSWKNDDRNGEGTFTKANGFYKRGSFKNNEAAKVKYYNPKNEEITLDEYNGIPKSGHGKIAYSNGNSYEGNLENGEPNGKGIYTLANGTVYEGDFVNGKFDGKGTRKWKDGANYTGDFKKDAFEGKGIYSYADGTIYEGDFVDGMFSGKGVKKFASGNIYTGEFKNDKFNGTGIYKWANGNTYTGNFKNDKFTGKGTITKLNGYYKKGDYKEDEGKNFKYFNPSGKEITEEEYKKN